MEITNTSGKGRAHFTIRGDVDEKGAEKMKAEFKKQDGPGLKEAVFDFKGVTHIGSAGLGKLLLFYKSVASRGGFVKIENPSDEITGLLKQLKLDAILKVG